MFLNFSTVYIYASLYSLFSPGAPLTYFNDGGFRVNFLGRKFLAKSDLFGSMKDAGIFLGREKEPGIFGGLLKKD